MTANFSIRIAQSSPWLLLFLLGALDLCIRHGGDWIDFVDLLFLGTALAGALWQCECRNAAA